MRPNETGAFYSWVRRRPQPAALLLDGKKKLLIEEGKHKWKNAIASLEELDPTRVEALDAEGNVIRVTQWGEEGDEPASDAKEEASGSRDIDLARIVLEATDRGAARHAEAYALAFDKMYGLVDVLAKRLTSLESAWQTTLEKRAEALEAASATEGGLESMLLPLLPDIMKRLESKKSNGKAEKS